MLRHYVSVAQLSENDETPNVTVNFINHPTIYILPHTVLMHSVLLQKNGPKW